MPKTIYVDPIEGEIWKPLVYNGVLYPRYEVSNKGRIKSGNQLRRTRLNKANGYMEILIDCGRPTMTGISVHRAVIGSFVELDLDAPEVNHKDGNKLNNILENLEWCTPKENVGHSWNTGLC